jgi:hypothetical protein
LCRVANDWIKFNQQDGDARHYCEVCAQTVHVDFGGDKNFAQHESGKVHCKKLAAQTASVSSSGASEIIRQSTLTAGFFTKKPAFPGPFSTQQLSQPVASTSAAPSSSIPQPQVPTKEEPIDVDSFSDSTTPPMPSSAADHILIHLRALTSNLPNSVLVARPNDIFACFAHDPRGEVEEGQDPYEMTVDRTLSNAVGYEKRAIDVAQMICRDLLGMDAFCRWIEICLIDLNIPAELLEVRVGRVCKAMKILYVIHCHRCNKYSCIDPAGLVRQTMTPPKMP